MLNWQRRSTTGLSLDYPTINILGYICYTISTSAFLYSDRVRQQYAARNPLAPEPTVRFNDFCFAAHAIVLSSFTYSQFWWRGFRHDRSRRVSRPIAGIIFGSLVGIIIVTCIIMAVGKDGGRDPNGWAWLDLVLLYHPPSLPRSPFP
jgi:cystinosin